MKNGSASEEQVDKRPCRADLAESLPSIIPACSRVTWKGDTKQKQLVSSAGQRMDYDVISFDIGSPKRAVRSTHMVDWTGSIAIIPELRLPVGRYLSGEALKPYTPQSDYLSIRL